MKKGRRSVISERVKAEVLRRLAAGEKAADLRREYKLTETTFRRNFSADASKVREVATALVEAEVALESLPQAAQISARGLADQMKRVSLNLAEAAVSGSSVVLALAKISAKRVQRLTVDCTPEDLKPIAALSMTANEASKVSMGLLAANKGKPEDTGDSNKDELLRDIAAMLPN